MPKHLPLVLLAFPLIARGEFILSTQDARITAGAPLELQLTVTNDSEASLSVHVPESLNVRLETDAALSALDMKPDRRGSVEIAPHQFLKLSLSGVVPIDVQGAARLSSTTFESNAIMLKIDPAHTAPAQSERKGESATQRTFDPFLVDRPPPLATSTYEPVYLVVGGDGGLNAKFQISLRYRLFDDRGPLANRWRWLDDFYLSFSQTSLWDLSKISKPFTDSSYRPRLFYAHYDLARRMHERLRIGLEAGVGHESNGKQGEDSRSFNMLYVQPTLTFGDVNGLRAYLAALVHNYIADDENPDMHDYRGYVDWRLGLGSKGGLDFWTTLRKGTRSDYGSIEWNASYPLSKLSGGDLTGWIMLQYFGGYGESLLHYREKTDSQLRLGIAVAL
ncbi:MAG TPA: phospholipase A [Steroidobacter sp.]|nr:phospholipase A [Steroidobacter sp.]